MIACGICGCACPKHTMTWPKMQAKNIFLNLIILNFFLVSICIKLVQYNTYDNPSIGILNTDGLVLYNQSISSHSDDYAHTRF